MTRLSVRSPGNSFLEVLPALARAGGNVFGRQLDDLTWVEAPVGTVKLRELKVIGPTETTAPTPRSK